MSDITDWIKNELYPTLYERIDQIFTEHDFKRGRKGWNSKTYLDGSPHKDRKDKTTINEGAPGYIREWGGEGKSLVDYVMSRDGIDFIPAVKYLAEKAGLQVPQNGTFDSEAYRKRSEQTTILEDANSYFVWYLHNAKGAEEVKTYLQGRSYTDEDIKDMGLGYIPSQAQAIKHLKEKKGYTLEAIKEALRIDTDTRIGSTHKITIPYRTGGGLSGFVFRAHGSAQPKYWNTSGLDRSSRFFNHTGRSKELIIVEGYLDALIADAKEAGNVVALGGTDIHQAQIEYAIKKGVETFTLCLDNDEAGKKSTLQAIDKLLEAGAGRIYVMVYSVNTALKDPDEVITREGIAAFEQMHRERVPYWAYWLQTIGDKYDHIQTTESRGLTYAELDELKTDLIKYGSRIDDPTDRDTYLNQILTDTGLRAYGVTRESLDIITAKLRTEKAEEERKAGLKKLLREAGDKLNNGDTTGVLELLDKQSKQIKSETGGAIAADTFLRIPTKEDITAALQTVEGSLGTGYTLYDNKTAPELELPGGALTIIAARTSHRKTSLMMNMALNIATRPESGEVFYFTYEESREAILTKLLNIYVNENLQGDGNNLKYIRAYLKKAGAGYRNESFISKADRFFTDLISTGKLRINYSALKAGDLCRAIETIKQKSKPAVVFIDYIQLLRSEGNFGGTKYLELQDICERLRETAIATGLPIVLGAQFNRTVKAEADIDSGNIREAGDIEQTADLVLGLWDRQFTRPGYVNRDGRKADGPAPGELYIEVLKGRSVGAGAREILHYNGNTWKITNEEPKSIFE